MAENKKSFLLYTDLLYTVEKLPPEKAGELFLHILKYVNDRNPQTEDIIIQIAFEPIKQQLKRDLIHWKDVCVKRSKSGKLGGRPKKQTKAKKANGFPEKQTKAKKADNENENDTDSVIDNENKERNIIPPPLFLLKQYCTERNNGIDPEYFYDWYQTRGWKVGKDKMTDWQSAVRTWEKRNGKKKEPELVMP